LIIFGSVFTLWDTQPKGKWLLVAKLEFAQSENQRVNIVLNWLEKLKVLVPVE